MRFIFFGMCVLIMLSLGSCYYSPKIYNSHTNFDMLSKGMEYTQVDTVLFQGFQNMNMFFRDNIRVRGQKYKYIQYSFTNRVISGGNSTTFFYDPYFIVFDESDKLLAMGYPYEFSRHENPLHQDIGKALMETIAER